jgi:DNA-binding transcriptional ArsR family regulator
MVTDSRDNNGNLAVVFKALGDETRLQMMTLLLDGDELCVCDFIGALGVSQSKASRHLRYLYHAGLVQDRREGTWMHYRLRPDLQPEQVAVIAALSQAVSDTQKQRLRQLLQDWRDRREAEAPC